MRMSRAKIAHRRSYSLGKTALASAKFEVEKRWPPLPRKKRPKTALVGGIWYHLRSDGLVLLQFSHRTLYFFDVSHPVGSMEASDALSSFSDRFVVGAAFPNTSRPWSSRISLFFSAYSRILRASSLSPF